MQRERSEDEDQHDDIQTTNSAVQKLRTGGLAELRVLYRSELL